MSDRTQMKPDVILDEPVKTFAIRKERLIAAPPQLVWESVLEELELIPDEKGKSMDLKLERRVGGRWYRDHGDGLGHLWGFVQVIKGPRILEITGPMMMSTAVASHVQYKLVAEGDKTRLLFVHTGAGLIDDKHVHGMNQGWGMIAESIEKNAKRRVEESSR